MSIGESKPLLSCNDLSASYDGIELFSALGFSLLKGSGLSVRGSNGSGKTALLKIIAGLKKPDSGEILLGYDEGQKIIKSADDYDGGLFYIGHKNAMNDSLSVRENLDFWANMRGDKILIPAALDYFGLGYYENMQYGLLSAGWKKRAALAKLICCPCKIWVLDEPLNNLDNEGIRLMTGMVESRIRGGGCVIMSTHFNNHEELDKIIPHALKVEDFADQGAYNE